MLLPGRVIALVGGTIVLTSALIDLGQAPGAQSAPVPAPTELAAATTSLATTPTTATPATPTATTEAMPPTPGPPTPTPALPEQGGPAGGVLGGYLFIDDVGNGARSAGDGVVAGASVYVERLPRDASDIGPTLFGAVSDVRGYWDVRALPDGRYRVSWDPPVRDPADLARAIPPAADIVVSPLQTLHRPSRIVEIRNANRILNIDFGMPPQSPVIGSVKPQLPRTGTGGGRAVTANEIVLFAGLAASAALGLGLVVRRRRGARG